MMNHVPETYVMASVVAMDNNEIFSMMQKNGSNGRFFFFLLIVTVPILWNAPPRYSRNGLF
jgi:hypothetical protein